MYLRVDTYAYQVGLRSVVTKMHRVCHLYECTFLRAEHHKTVSTLRYVGIDEVVYNCTKGI